MAQKALSPAGGSAPLVHARVLPEEAARLTSLQRSRGDSTMSEVVRQVLRIGLDQLDRADAGRGP
ncbi:MAG: hypothetical protein M3Y33_07300, partial [Actinomycetota bacterium]|nr:hypothetical protein [Actinomycetota bacterium]